MSLREKIRFDRNELAGAFGDIGTDLPLIVGMILTNGLDTSSVLIVFGIMQVLTASVYGIPMPVQPLKAMATIMLTQQLSGNLLYGAGLAIGVVMLLLSVTGTVVWIARVVPKSVVRGLQFGLGITLATLALERYVQADLLPGYVLGFLGFCLALLFLGNRRYPAAVFVIGLGVLYAFMFKIDFRTFSDSLGISLPKAHVPSWSDILTGFVLLAVPQIPLSIGNSVLATSQTVVDLFPDRKVSVRRISLTYAFMNLVNPFLSGIPTCHGAGGLTGHYAFGARTGGSVLMYGTMYIGLGLLFSRGFEDIVKVFPLPILGVVLLFEGLTLMMLARDITENRSDLMIAFLVALMVVGLPYGYVVGLLVGTAIWYLAKYRIVHL